MNDRRRHRLVVGAKSGRFRRRTRSGSSLGRTRVVLVLKTSHGGQWTLPHVDELRSRGHDVIAVLPAEGGQLRTALVDRGVRVVDSLFSFRFRPRIATLTGLARLRRQIRDLQPDVLHYHLYASTLAVRVASLGLGVPRVQMVAGPLHLESAPIRTVERIFMRMDTTIIAGSEYTANVYRGLGLGNARLRVIPYGVDTTRFQPLDPGVRRQIRDALGIRSSTFVAVMVAVVYAPKRSVYPGCGIKGHDTLLRAWADFHRDHPGSHLLLVGGGFDDAGEHYRQYLIDRFDVTAPGNGVTWLESVDDVRPYYAAADVSVSPSLSENHGAADEAGAMAVPSIVSDAGALPETVDERSGWVVPRADPRALSAALKVAHDEHGDKLIERGRRAREFVVERFDVVRSAALVANAVETAATRSSRPSGSGTIDLYSEIRFGTDESGRWASMHAVYDDAQLVRYRRGGRSLRLVGRADPRPGTAVFPFDEVGVVPLPYYIGARGLVGALPRLIPALFRTVRESDRIILRIPGVIGFLAAALCAVLRRRYVVEVVGDPAAVLEAGVAGSAGQRCAPTIAALMRWTVRRASGSVFVTSSALQRLYPPRSDTPSAAVSDIRLPETAFVSRPRDVPPTGPFHLITVGSQEQHYKGHDVLLNAIRMMVDDGHDVVATVVGGGRMHDEIVALAHSLGVGGRLRFTGNVNERKLIDQLLDEATIFVLPSRTEGLPRALIEAMARALPAVASRVGGVPELLDANCMVPVDDAAELARVVTELLLDPERMREQSKRNLDVAADYRLDHLEQLFSAWLESVPSNRPAVRRLHNG